MTNEQKHTQGVWQACERMKGYAIQAPHNPQIGPAPIDVAYGLSEANAARIIACVNACDGMLPEVLDEYEKEGGMFLVFGKHIANRDEEIHTLRAEVERLRESAQMALALIKTHWIEEHGQRDVGEAWGALESALGGGK